MRSPLHRMRRGLVTAMASGALLVLLAGAPTFAMADPPTDADLARAAELKRAGDAAIDTNRYADALVAYETAYKIAPSAALLYNEGRALQALNRNPEALTKLEAFKATAPDDVRSKVPDLDKLLASLQARVATLGVTCNVPGARILLDHTVVGTAPLAPLKLNAGATTIDVEAEGYFPYRTIVDLQGGQVMSVSAALLGRDRNGVLVVNGSTPGADVTIDDEHAGIAPAERVVAAGTHHLLLKHPTFLDTEASVVIAPGQRKEVTVPLRPPSVASRWWFWTTLGAVVATAGVVTAVALSSRSADSGTIAPGKITSTQSLASPLRLHF